VLRTAVIGCGFQGRVHLESFRKLEEVDVVAVCDVDAARCEALAEEFGVAGRHTDYRQLLGKVKEKLARDRGFIL